MEPVKIAMIGALLWAGWAGVAAQSSNARATPAPAGARLLTRGEMRSIRGGITTNSMTPSGNGLDNQAYEVSWTNDHSDRGFAIFANSTKVTPATVIPALSSGTWQTRTLWPIPGAPTYGTKYDNFDGTWGSSFTGSSLEVNRNIRVLKVRLWNTRIGGVTTAVTDAEMSNVLDNLSFDYAWDTTNSADAVYAQCGTGTSTRKQRLQFRYAGSSFVSLPGCNLDLECSGSVNASDPCADQAYNFATHNGTDFSELHIFAVPSVSGNDVGCNMTKTDNSRYMVYFEAGFSASSHFTTILAHEIGHFFLGEHTRHRLVERALLPPTR